MKTVQQQLQAMHTQRMAVYELRSKMHQYVQMTQDQTERQSIANVDSQLNSYDHLLLETQQLAMTADPSKNGDIQNLLAQGDKTLKACTKSYLEIRTLFPQPALLDKAMVGLHTAHKDELGYVPELVQAQSPKVQSPGASNGQSYYEKKFGHHIEHDANGMPLINFDDDDLLDPDLEPGMSPDLSPGVNSASPAPAN